MIVQIPMLRNDGDESKADERGHRHKGPLLGVKQTKSGAKRTSAFEGLLSGRQRKSEGAPLNSRL